MIAFLPALGSCILRLMHRRILQLLPKNFPGRGWGGVQGTGARREPRCLVRFNVTLALAPSFRDTAGGPARADPASSPRGCAGPGAGLCQACEGWALWLG